MTPDDLQGLDVLGMAYAETGRYEDAVQLMTRAVESARGQGKTSLARDLSRRLELYREELPYRYRLAGG